MCALQVLLIIIIIIIILFQSRIETNHAIWLFGVYGTMYFKVAL